MKLYKENAMALDNAFFMAWQPRLLAILRIVTAYLFIPHGTAKLFGAWFFCMGKCRWKWTTKTLRTQSGGQ